MHNNSSQCSANISIKIGQNTELIDLYCEVYVEKLRFII